ncbi:MAG: hypothetical protein KGI27_13360 [Thaumarchaeota archaeon]|nr:hypothetical protein [Nitrososphaerota archaeon]
MRTVEIDRVGILFRVTWIQGFQPIKTRDFASREEAEKFAEFKMGKRGCVISSLDMTAEQLGALAQRRAKSAAFLASLKG